MNSRKRLLQFLVSAAAMMAALTVAVAPAHAATRATVAPAALPQTAVVLTTTDGPSVVAAATHCKTSSIKGNVVSQPGGWPILAWFEQTTYWCYNGQIVTSRSTRYTAGVTATGSLAGFSYKGIVAGSEGWHCYQAAGSTRPCSGNTQYAEGEFEACAIKVGCEFNYIDLQSSENYKGQFFQD